MKIFKKILGFNTRINTFLISFNTVFDTVLLRVLIRFFTRVLISIYTLNSLDQAYRVTSEKMLLYKVLDRSENLI